MLSWQNISLPRSMAGCRPWWILGLGYLTLNKGFIHLIWWWGTSCINLHTTLSSNLLNRCTSSDNPVWASTPKTPKPGGRTQTFTRSGQHSCCGGTRRKSSAMPITSIRNRPLANSHGGELVYAGPTKFLKVRPSQRNCTSLANNPDSCARHQASAANKISLRASVQPQKLWCWWYPARHDRGGRCVGFEQDHIGEAIYCILHYLKPRAKPFHTSPGNTINSWATSRWSTASKWSTRLPSASR